MTANFDAAKSAAFAITMLDWRDFGAAYAAEVIALSNALARTLDIEGIPVFSGTEGFTKSYQSAMCAEAFVGAQSASKTLHKTGFLACGIGLPIPAVNGNMNGLRIGTPELFKWGIKTARADHLAMSIAHGLKNESIMPEDSRWQKDFDTLQFIH